MAINYHRILRCNNTTNVATLFRESVRMKLTLSKLGLRSPPGLLKLQSSIVGVKTPWIGVFFITLEIYWGVHVKNASHGHLDISSTSYGKKKVWESNSQFDSWPLKVKNQLDPGACRWSATHHWKALEESYKFALDLIPIGGLSK